jgi:hypothetical protein
MVARPNPSTGQWMAVDRTKKSQGCTLQVEGISLKQTLGTLKT